MRSALAHAGARGGVRAGRVAERALRRVRRSVRRGHDSETAQQQICVQAARWLGRRLEQHEQHDTHRACGEGEHLRPVEAVEHMRQLGAYWNGEDER